MDWFRAIDSDILIDAHEWNGKVRIQFAKNIPFDASFMIDLRPQEARELANRMLGSADKIDSDKGRAP